MVYGRYTCWYTLLVHPGGYTLVGTPWLVHPVVYAGMVHPVVYAGMLHPWVSQVGTVHPWVSQVGNVHPAVYPGWYMLGIPLPICLPASLGR